MNNWACPICNLCKGTHQYSVKDKPTLTKSQQRAAQRLKVKLQDVLKEPPNKTTSEQAQPSVIAGAIKPTDNFHINFGYSITASNKKDSEKYFLLVRLEEKDFMWPFASMTREAQELLLQDFVDLTGIVPATIRCDNEFGENQLLICRAKKFGTVVCPTPAYNHTMAAHIEGSVRIAKEHL
eukprot:3867896-Rhodomonas_salina.1